MQRQNPVDAGAVLWKSVKIVAGPAARPHSAGFISVGDVAVDDCVVAHFFNIAQNKVCTRFDGDFRNIACGIECALTVCQDGAVDNGQRILSKEEITVSDLDVRIFIRPNVWTYGNASSRTGCHVIGNNQSARCAARHRRRSDGIGPVKSALRSEVQIAVVLHIDIRVDHVVLRIDFSLDVVFLGRFSVVSDDKVSAVQVGFLCLQTAAVDLDETVVNGEFSGFNISRVVHISFGHNDIVPNRRAGVIVFAVRLNRQDVSFLEAGVIRRSAALNRHIVIFRFALVVECPGNKGIGNLGSVNFTLIGLVTGYNILVVNGLFASFFSSGRASDLYGLVVPDRGA